MKHMQAALLAALLLVGLNKETDAKDTASVGQLKAQLLASPSATQTLTVYCARLRLADPAMIHAVRDIAAARPASAAIRGLLRVTSGEPVRSRRVRLACGGHVLSDADNWYVPARLTREMNDTLDHSDIPFGIVVKPLGFQRRTLRAETLHDRKHVLRVTALLVDRQGLPFSLVQENYSRILVQGP